MKHLYLIVTLLFIATSAFGQDGTFNVETPGTLSELIGEDNMYNYSSITVTGDLNGDDIAFIRDMAEWSLEELDLSGANIVEGGDAYYMTSYDSYYTANDTVGPYMFHGLYLTKIALPNSAVYLGEEALSENEDLEEVIIGSGIKAFDDMVFYYCESLEEITIPGNVEDMGGYTFYMCNALTTVNLNEGLKRIGEVCFYFCTQLSDITLPNTLETIDIQAFFNCQSLPQINIPASVDTIGIGAFDRCYSLTSIDVDKTSENFCDVDGVLYSKDMTKFYRAPIGKEYGEVAIPESVVEIGQGAFDECETLTTLTMGDNVTTMGSGVFADCKGLTTIKLSKLLTEIPGGTFFGCNALANITWPETITSIGSSAFMSCRGLTTLDIPSGCTYIGDAAFYGCSSVETMTLPATLEKVDDIAFYNCSALKTVTCYATVPPTCTRAPFEEVDVTSCTLNVPEASVNDYKAAKYWQDFLINGIAGINDVYVNGGDPIYYDLNGRILTEPQAGVNIVKMPNGTTKKIVIVK